MTTIDVKYTNDEGEEIVLTLPAKHEVCSRCEGHGTHLTPSIGEHAYSSEEFCEAFADEEDREQYFKRGGIYDVTCEECKGKNVVLVVDEDRLADKDKAAYQEYVKYEERMAQYDAEDRATSRMEDGYRE